MQVLVIHGGNTFETYEDYIEALSRREPDLERINRSDWKAHLQDALGETYQVVVPKMPNKWNAQYTEWKIWFEKLLKILDREIILVGHSLGGIFLAKYLAENECSKDIASIHIVAAPFDNAHRADTSLAAFQLPDSLDGLARQCSNIYLYHSTDDPIVPFDDLAKYEKALPEATTVVLNDRLHIWQEEFPELIANIIK